MLPTLLIGRIALPTYPLFLLLAYWAAMWLGGHQAKKFEFDGDHIYNAGLFGLLSGIIGARLWFVLSHWENYASDIGQAFSLSRSALSAPEGAIIAGLVVLIYLQREKVPFGKFFDAVASGLALAFSIANVGAFLGGEWLGAPSNVPWAIEIVGTARHPVQLYEALSSLIILGTLLYLAKYRPWSSFHFWLFVALYGVSRLFLEIFRARPTLIGDGYLAVQIVALAGIVVALAVMARNFNSNLGKTNTATS